jgi:hypothetical protein
MQRVPKLDCSSREITQWAQLVHDGIDEAIAHAPKSCSALVSRSMQPFLEVSEALKYGSTCPIGSLVQLATLHGKLIQCAYPSRNALASYYKRGRRSR